MGKVNRDFALFGTFLTLLFCLKALMPGEALQASFFLYGFFYPMLGSAKPFFWIVQVVEFLNSCRLMLNLLEGGVLMSALDLGVTVSPGIRGDFITRVYRWLFTSGVAQVLILVLLIYAFYGVQAYIGLRLFRKVQARLEVQI